MHAMCGVGRLLDGTASMEVLACGGEVFGDRLIVDDLEGCRVVASGRSRFALGRGRWARCLRMETWRQGLADCLPRGAREEGGFAGLHPAVQTQALGGQMAILHIAESQLQKHLTPHAAPPLTGRLACHEWGFPFAGYLGVVRHACACIAAVHRYKVCMATLACLV